MGKVKEKGKEWVCPNFKECGKKFAHKQSLNNHKKNCGVGKLPCNLCSKTFTRLAYLKKHKQQCRGLVIKVNNCHICGKELQSPWHLRRHIQQKHCNEV